MLNFIVRTFKWSILVALTSIPAYSLGEEFPTRPLTILVGFEQGGSTDLQARVMGEILEEKLGVPVTIVNVPGSGGGIAAAMLADSQEEGYVMMYSSSHPFVFTPMVYDTSYATSDFRFVASMALQQAAFVVSGLSNVNTWDDLLTAAQQQPEITFASQTPIDRILVRMIAQKEGLNVRIIPTTGGAGMARHILRNEMDFAYSGGTHSNYTDDGRMRVILGLSQSPLVGYEDVPTILDVGMEHFDEILRVVAVPANSSDEQIQVLQKALQHVASDSRFVAVSEQLRIPVSFRDEAYLASFFADRLTSYEFLINNFSDSDVSGIRVPQ